MKRQVTSERKYLQITYLTFLIKNIFRLYKVFSKKSKETTQKNRLAKDFKRHFIKENVQMVIKQMKIC